MNKRPILKLALPLLVLAVGFAGFSYLKASRPERSKPQPREKTWQVDSLSVTPQALAPELTLYGQAESPDLLQAAAPGAGQVLAVPVRVGEQVEQGRLLVQLDPRDFELAVEQSRAELADLQAQLEELALRHRADQQSLTRERELLALAEAKVERERRLGKQKLGSESALDAALSELGRQQLALINRQTEVRRHAAAEAQLQARLARARSRLAEAELALARSRVAAPFDGVVSSVAVAVGDRVQTGKVLVSLYPLDQLEVRARIPARYQAELQAALAAGRQLQATTRLAGGGEPVRLKLVRLAGQADASGIDGYFRVLSGAERLRLGNLLQIAFQRPAQDGLIALPFPALYGNGRVYLLRDERMHGVDVELVGQRLRADGEGQVLVRSELIKPGDRVVTTHLPNAVSGLKVRDAGPRLGQSDGR